MTQSGFGVALHEDDVSAVRGLYSQFVNEVATLTGRAFSAKFAITLKGANVKAAYQWEADGVPIRSLFADEDEDVMGTGAEAHPTSAPQPAETGTGAEAHPTEEAHPSSDRTGTEAHPASSRTGTEAHPTQAEAIVPRVVRVGEVVVGRHGLPYTVHSVTEDDVSLVTDSGEVVEMSHREAEMYFAMERFEVGTIVDHTNDIGTGTEAHPTEEDRPTEEDQPAGEDQPADAGTGTEAHPTTSDDDLDFSF